MARFLKCTQLSVEFEFVSLFASLTSRFSSFSSFFFVLKFVANFFFLRKSFIWLWCHVFESSFHHFPNFYINSLDFANFFSRRIFLLSRRCEEKYDERMPSVELETERYDSLAYRKLPMWIRKCKAKKKANNFLFFSYTH